jgi:hypothetical protein
VAGGTARFKVVRLPPDKMPEGRIQYVEQLTPEHLWREADVNPLRLTEIYVVADDPVATAARWAHFAALLPTPVKDGVRLQTARGTVVIGTRERMAKVLGDAPPAPAIAGYALACRDRTAFAKRCRQSGLQVKGAIVRLPPSLGGCWRLA